MVKEETMNSNNTCGRESNHNYSANGTMHLPACKSTDGHKDFQAMDINIKTCVHCGIPEIVYRVAYIETYGNSYKQPIAN